MASPKFIEIGGNRIPWRDVLEIRREQRKAAAKAEQPALFELREDCRPAGDRKAAACKSRLSHVRGLDQQSLYR